LTGVTARPLVEQAEVLAVEPEMRGILAREHRVGLRARRDEDRARGQSRLPNSCHTPSPSLWCCDLERARVAVASTSTLSGVSPSAKRMPSSSAFSTSSWFSV
jgi:hypothetical protein